MDWKQYIIAFSGCARVGKTSSAQIAGKYLESKEMDVYYMSFAKPLKDGLAIMGLEKDKDYDLYRSVAQQVGTDMLRRYNDNWWVDLMRENITQKMKESKWNGPRVVIIDDVRFPNESSLVKEYQDGYNMFVYGGPGRIDLTLPVYEHDSETMGVFYEKTLRGEESGNYPQGPGMDMTIDNSGSLKSLEQKTRQVLDSILEGRI